MGMQFQIIKHWITSLMLKQCRVQLKSSSNVHYAIPSASFENQWLWPI